jgi:hypothetical protein
MSSMDTKYVNMTAILGVGSSFNLLRARFGDYGGCVMTGMHFSETFLYNKRRVTRCVIMMPIIDMFSPNCIAKHLENSHIEMIGITLSRWYEFKLHQILDVKEFLELFDLPSYTYTKRTSDGRTLIGVWRQLVLC